MLIKMVTLKDEISPKATAGEKKALQDPNSQKTINTRPN